MASPATVDIDALLAPISEDNPCGVALREDSEGSQLYSKLYDARKEARLAERNNALAAMGDDGTGAPPAFVSPDWKLVVRLAKEILSNKSKDLWAAAWFVEGLAREHGFAGMRDGFHVVRELCVRYFDGIHPRPDEEGVMTTVAQLAGLNGEGADGTLIVPIAAVPITQGNSAGPFSGRDYADALELSKVTDPDLRARRISGGMATLEVIESAARETPPSFYVELREDIAAAIAEFNQMNAVLTEKCGKDKEDRFFLAPPSSRISAALEQAQTRVRLLAGEPEVPADADEASATSDATGSGGGVVGSGNISSREDAFKTLMKVAEYFRRAEPHSPVSYALEQAVRWGRMPLPELIRDLVSDDGVRREFFRRTGMKIDSDDN